MLMFFLQVLLILIFSALCILYNYIMKVRRARIIFYYYTIYIDISISYKYNQ